MNSRLNTVTDDRSASAAGNSKRPLTDPHVIKVQPLKRSEMQVRHLTVITFSPMLFILSLYSHLMRRIWEQERCVLLHLSECIEVDSMISYKYRSPMGSTDPCCNAWDPASVSAVPSHAAPFPTHSATSNKVRHSNRSLTPHLYRTKHLPGSNRTVIAFYSYFISFPRFRRTCFSVRPVLQVC